MWKNPRADMALVTNSHFDHMMVKRRRSSQSQVRKTDAHSDVVLRGLGYKECRFFR
jgi:L-ascorbate metabolism protein UlaG (beta-lactamase superfamily)